MTQHQNDATGLPDRPAYMKVSIAQRDSMIEAIIEWEDDAASAVELAAKLIEILEGTAASDH